ncbi:MAG: hypothetical protein AAF488_03085 [Planctomycetota bacterium]
MRRYPTPIRRLHLAGVLVALIASGCATDRQDSRRRPLRIDETSGARRAKDAGEIRRVVPVEAGSVRLEWSYGADRPGDRFTVRRLEASAGQIAEDHRSNTDGVVVGRVDRRGGGEPRGWRSELERFEWIDDRGGVHASELARYAVDVSVAGEVVETLRFPPLAIRAPLASRLAYELHSRGIDAVEFYRWESDPQLPDGQPIARPAGWSSVGVDRALAAANTEAVELPTPERWRLDSRLDYRVQPWFQERIDEERFRVFETWTVELRQADELVWRASEVRGFGLRRTAAPYHEVGPWREFRPNGGARRNEPGAAPVGDGHRDPSVQRGSSSSHSLLKARHDGIPSPEVARPLRNRRGGFRPA